eukprot:TRINITY_DN8479_c0_g1_i1.p1 TRINITY_DN8479_c0_g1~~TRINITY_DN8479_c0_g1_i1.p1  ORF type:complete len:269 (+),score=12.49 TRINITY_DN8479_c0_g1_i1:140-946(+)
MNLLTKLERLEERKLTKIVGISFVVWTLLFWLSVPIIALMFYFSLIDFVTSAQISLYGISIWLNGWLFALIKKSSRTKFSFYHDCLVLWMISYAMTNLFWEIPWLITSPWLFKDLNTLNDVVAKTGWMRESIFNMYFWALSSFSSCDLRTVNHNSTFYSLELYAFINVPATILFLYLNYKKYLFRYLLPLITCGCPIAFTFVFSASEAIGGFADIPGGVADVLLALVWTQYQYFFFPMLVGFWSTVLFLEDLRVYYEESNYSKNLVTN